MDFVGIFGISGINPSDVIQRGEGGEEGLLATALVKYSEQDGRKSRGEEGKRGLYVCTYLYTPYSVDKLTG